MNRVIVLTLVFSVCAFFAVVILCIAHYFGLLKTRVDRKAVHRMFTISVITLLIAVGGFVTASFRYLSFSATPYLGFMDAIANIQKVLLKEGLLKDFPDGVLGPNTFAAVKQFQTTSNLVKADGALTQETINRLFDWKSRTSIINQEDQAVMRIYMRKPSFNRIKEQTKWLQMVLQENGCYAGSADGILRPELLEAARDFQRKRGILPDGTIGPDTLLCAIEYDINRLNISRRLKDIPGDTLQTAGGDAKNRAPQP